MGLTGTPVYNKAQDLGGHRPSRHSMPPTPRVLDRGWPRRLARNLGRAPKKKAPRPHPMWFGSLFAQALPIPSPEHSGEHHPPSSPTASDSASAASSSSSQQHGQQHTAAQQQHAERLLLEAEQAFDAEEDAKALRAVRASLASGCTLKAAKTLLKHLEAYGPGSNALAVVTRTLQASDDYAVLGLSRPSAGEPTSPARLKKAYKKLCLDLHPDRCHARGAEAAFKRLQAAIANLDPNAPKPPPSATKSASASSAKKQAEQRAMERDRGWYARGVDPRYGQKANRHKSRPQEVKKRANGRAQVTPPKAGPPPRTPTPPQSHPANPFEV